MVLRLIDGLLDLAAPPSCIACRLTLRGSGNLCPSCLRGVPLVETPCPTCSEAPASVSHLAGRCPACRTGPPEAPLRFAGWYEDTLRQLILAAKWERHPAAVERVSEWTLAAALKGSWLDDVDGWCPVPRDPWRWLRHGVPLSEYVGRYISRHLGIPRVAPPTRRRRPPQARLVKAERLGNLRGAFSVGTRRAARLQGRRVLLVDDVLTTGSTVRECVRALESAGARVKVAVVAVKR